MESSPSLRKSLTPYITGFVLSIALTLTAYSTAISNKVTNSYIVGVVVGLAVLQLFIQLIFFLHLGSEQKPRLRLLVFSFMCIVVGILVAGTLWIMYNLDYNMTPMQMDTTLMKEEGIRL